MSPSLRAPAAVLCALSCAACSLLARTPAPVRFALLVPVDELPGARLEPPPPSPVRVGLGPVTLPEYVRRPELVTREGSARIVASEERWAEPLDLAVERVLAIDLQHALGVGRIVEHPWYASDRPDLQIEIAFARFERDGSGNAVVAASWSARRLDGSEPPIEGQSLVAHEAAPDGASTALALSRGLADLCREIALACGPLGAVPAAR